VFGAGRRLGGEADDEGEHHDEQQLPHGSSSRIAGRARPLDRFVGSLATSDCCLMTRSLQELQRTLSTFCTSQ
jgi:hypothetical protein